MAATDFHTKPALARESSDMADWELTSRYCVDPRGKEKRGRGQDGACVSAIARLREDWVVIIEKMERK